MTEDQAERIVTAIERLTETMDAFLRRQEQFEREVRQREYLADHVRRGGATGGGSPR